MMKYFNRILIGVLLVIALSLYGCTNTENESGNLDNIDGEINQELDNSDSADANDNIANDNVPTEEKPNIDKDKNPDINQDTEPDINQDKKPNKKHNLSKVKVEVLPTYTDKGTAKLFCNNDGCSYFEELVLPALTNLDYKIEIIKTATCTENGSKTYTLNCNNLVVIDTEIDALGHSFSDYEIVDNPTLDNVGKAIKKCTRCGDIQSLVLPKLNDKDYDVTIVDATCVNKGSITYTLKNNNKFSFVLPIELKEHSYSNWDIKVPTTTEKGVAIRICSCGKEEKIDLPYLNSNEYIVNVNSNLNKVEYSYNNIIKFSLDIFTYRNIDNSTCAITGFNIAQSDVKVPNMIDNRSVVKVDDDAFSIDKGNFIKSIVLCEGIKSIGNGAFKNQNIVELVLPNSLIDIGDYAFYGCANLKKVTAKNLQNIGEFAFAECRLQSFTINKTCKNIGAKVFINQFADMVIESELTKEEIESLQNNGNFNSDWNKKEQGCSDTIRIVNSVTKEEIIL